MAEEKIIWSEEAAAQLEEIFDFLVEEVSYETANYVLSSIFDSVDDILIYPLKYELDRFRINNSGDFRALTVFHYRISYQVTEEAIKIVQVRHTSRKPKYHW